MINTNIEIFHNSKENKVFIVYKTIVFSENYEHKIKANEDLNCTEQQKLM